MKRGVRRCFLLHHCDEARLTNAGLPVQQHSPAGAGTGCPPVLDENADLLSAPNQAGAAAPERKEAARNIPFSDDPPGTDRLRDSLEGDGSQISQLEQLADQPPRALADDQRPGLGETLQAGRYVRRLADRASLLRGSGTEKVA